MPQRRVGEPEPGAGSALIVPQPAIARVGDGGVRENQLARSECAGIRFRDPRAIAEERQLDAEPFAPGVLQPAGDVPPFTAKFGMGAGIAREAHRVTGDDRRVIVSRECTARDKDERARKKAPPVHAAPATHRRRITNPP
jgi:hypothetical protein